MQYNKSPEWLVCDINRQEFHHFAGPHGDHASNPSNQYNIS
jgi:hypothetical protein